MSSSPRFAMVDIPLVGELRWGTRTADALHSEPAVARDGVRIFYSTQQRDLEEPMRVQLVHAAHDVLRAPGFRRQMAKEPRRRARWFLWEAKNRLYELTPEQLTDATTAVLQLGRATAHSHRALIEVSAMPAGAATDTFFDILLDQLDAIFIAASPAVARGVGLAPTLTIGTSQDDSDDARALQSFRDDLLALEWPDSAAVGRRFGSTEASAVSRVSRERTAGALFGVWAGRDHGGYRHPDFQFLPSGSVHPRLPELLDALARRPDLNPRSDRSGWERAYWLYQPRGRLSAQSLALRAAEPAQLRADPERFAALDTAARTPAEVFAAEPQAVIDLARDDAAAQTPPDAPDGARG